MSDASKFKNLVELYERSVEQFATRPLFGTKVAGEWKWMTYKEFGVQVEELRGGLVDLGLARGDRVAVIANNRPEWATAAYATYGIGAAYVPMYEAQLDKEWKYIINDCGAKLVIAATDDIASRIAGFGKDLPTVTHVITLTDQGGAGIITYADVLARGRQKPVPAYHPDPKEIAGFIYTSGTTGNPKGVLLSHGNFASNVSAMHAVFPMASDDRSLSFLPWAHSFGQTVELHALISMGASMGIAESVDKIIVNLAEVKPTLLFSVPRIFNKIYDGLNKRMAAEGGLKKSLFEAGMKNAAYRKELAAKGQTSGIVELKHKFFDKVVFSKVRDRFGGRLKYAFSGGAAISKTVAEFIDNLGITVYEGYGLTETSPIATANWPGSRRIGSIGKAIPGVRIVIDKVATGDEKNGEIVVYGPNVMQGYHNLPEENDKVFTPDGGFRTGDMGMMDDEGFVYVTGRIKEQYKLENGKYVAPAALEEKLKLSPYVANVMVYGDNKPFNVAVVVPDLDTVTKWCTANGVDTNTDTMLNDTRVKKLVEDEIERFSDDFKQFEKVKKVVLIGEDFTTQNDMLTPSLKLKRRVVMNKYGDRIQALYS